MCVRKAVSCCRTMFTIIFLFKLLVCIFLDRIYVSFLPTRICKLEEEGVGIANKELLHDLEA